MTTASSLVPLWDRAAEWARRLAMIREATSFLYVSTYYIEYDTYGTDFLDALLDAQRRGVAVQLLIDGFGQRLGGVLMSRESKTALTFRLEELRDAGAMVIVYRPGRPLQRWLGGGQHVKIQVSEAGEAIFGSSNITRTSFEGWNEYSVALRGPVVPLLLESYRQFGGEVNETHLRALVAGADDCAANLGLEYWLCNPNMYQGPCGPIGWRGPNVVTERLIDMLDAARESIGVTSFYFKPVEQLLEALVRAARRGVLVEVLHSHREALPATELAWIAAAVHYDRLLSAGVRVYENRHGEHSKIILIDRAWVSFGSYNFEDAAHDRMAEAMLTSRDPRAVAPATSIFDMLRDHPDNTQVTAQDLPSLSARLKVKRALLGRFKRWM
jgi:cardiolipin synthase A/B